MATQRWHTADYWIFQDGSRRDIDALTDEEVVQVMICALRMLDTYPGRYEWTLRTRLWRKLHEIDDDGGPFEKAQKIASAMTERERRKSERTNTSKL